MSMIDKLREEIIKRDKKIKELEERIYLLQEEFSLIYRIGELLGACLEFERACSVILKEGIKITRADKGLFIMGKKDKLKVISTIGFPEDKMLQYQRNINRSLIKHYINENKEKIMKDIEDYHPEAKFLNIKNILIIPMEKSGALAFSADDRVFSEKDLELAKTLATYSVKIVKNAEFYLSMQELFFDTVLALSSAIDARDPYTAGHSRKVKDIALAIADQLNLSEQDKRILHLGALLHDIGKLTIPEKILTKPGRLSEEEYKLIKTHPERGAKILSNVTMLEGVLTCVAQHQEKFDGTGYPKGLKGKEISLFARILAVADAYDAMTSERAYRRAFTKEEAKEELRRCSGTHFDPQIVEAFFKAKIN
jgi:putative nucleotidyltransferase with HDIG domain